MTITETQVANSALLKLGSDTIASLAEDTKPGRMVNALFDLLRDEMLRSHPWNFATTRLELEPSEDAPDFEFTYKFDLPDECLRLLKIYNNTARYQVEGHSILSDSDLMDITYIQVMDDPTFWDSLFLEAFATRLAAEIAYGLTGSPALQGKLLDDFNMKLRVAKQIDAQENFNDPFTATELLDARRSSSFLMNDDGFPII